MCARYYPNGSNQPKNPKNPLSPGHNGATLEDNSFATWLYTAEWNDENLQRFRLLYAVGPTRDYIDYLLDLRDDAAYLKRYGLTPGDIRDPRKLGSVTSGSKLIAGGLNFVSDNVKWLYN